MVIPTGTTCNCLVTMWLGHEVYPNGPHWKHSNRQAFMYTACGFLPKPMWNLVHAVRLLAGSEHVNNFGLVPGM